MKTKDYTELAELAIGVLNMDRESKYFSKVKGNRNWCIRTERLITEEGKTYKSAWMGRYGAMTRHGMMGESLRYICKYNVRWYEFTYKKDFEEMVSLLEADGYRIRWI